MTLNEFGQPVGDTLPDWTSRAGVRPVVLEGRTVRLEPLTARHAGDLWTALVEESPVELWTYMPYGPFTERRGFETYVDDLTGDPALVPLALVVEGRAAGVSVYLRDDPENGVVETGHIALGARLQRTTPATEAAYLMMRHVFDDLGYRRYEWKCNALNAGSRRAAERFGFTPEGVFRRHRVVKGRTRDTAWFAITDVEWPAIRDELERWLDPENFDADGRQRTPLTTT